MTSHSCCIFKELSFLLLLLLLVRPNFGSEGDVTFCVTQIFMLVAVWPMTSSN